MLLFHPRLITYAKTHLKSTMHGCHGVQATTVIFCVFCLVQLMTICSWSVEVVNFEHYFTAPKQSHRNLMTIIKSDFWNATAAERERNGVHECFITLAAFHLAQTRALFHIARYTIAFPFFFFLSFCSSRFRRRPGGRGVGVGGGGAGVVYWSKYNCACANIPAYFFPCNPPPLPAPGWGTEDAESGVPSSENSDVSKIPSVNPRASQITQFYMPILPTGILPF